MALPPITRTREHVRLVSPLDSAIDLDAMGRRALAAGGDALVELRARLTGDGPELEQEVAEDPKVIGAAVLQRYSVGDDLNADRLLFKAGEEPTWFTIRGLNQAELNVASLIGDAPPTDRAKAALYHSTVILRVALEKVDGWDGWEPDRRETRFDTAVWQLEPILHIPPAARMFLGATVYTLSTITEKKSESSGS